MKMAISTISAFAFIGSAILSYKIKHILTFVKGSGTSWGSRGNDMISPSKVGGHVPPPSPIVYLPSTSSTAVKALQWQQENSESEVGKEGIT